MTSNNTQEDQEVFKSYKSSWLDRLNSKLNRLPVPIWVTYFVFVMVIFGVGILIQFFDDSVQSIYIPPIMFISHFQIVYVLSLIAFLDKQAGKAISDFRPVLIGNDVKVKSLNYEITTLPSRPMAVVSIIATLLFSVLGYVILNAPPIYSGELPISQAMDIFTKTPTGYYGMAIWTMLWVINSIFIYHTYHQLKTIDHIYKHHTEINLFRQGELFAFSKLSAYTGIGFVLTSPVWLAIDSGLVNIFINLGFAVITVIIFISPLLGVQRLLKEQKDQLIKEVMIKKEALIRDLFIQLEERDLGQIEDYDRGLSSLERAHSEIEKIPTWPWQSGTLQQVVGAILLPITIWMIQYSLAQLLGN